MPCTTQKTCSNAVTNLKLRLLWSGTPTVCCDSFGTHFIPGLSQKAADVKSGTRLRILLWRPWVEARLTVTASKPVTNLLWRSWNVTNRVWRGWDAHVTSLGAVTVLACNRVVMKILWWTIYFWRECDESESTVYSLRAVPFNMLWGVTKAWEGGSSPSLFFKLLLSTPSPP